MQYIRSILQQKLPYSFPLTPRMLKSTLHTHCQTINLPQIHLHSVLLCPVSVQLLHTSSHQAIRADFWFHLSCPVFFPLSLICSLWGSSKSPAAPWISHPHPFCYVCASAYSDNPHHSSACTFYSSKAPFTIPFVKSPAATPALSSLWFCSFSPIDYFVQFCALADILSYCLIVHIY